MIFLTTYKYGWKTSYYQNTHDMKSDEIEDVESGVKPELNNLLKDLSSAEEEACDSCAISKVDSMTVFNEEHVDTKKQPMFFGKPLGIQRYDSYKYPVFEKLTTQMLGYFWRPEEVSLQKDRGDYQSLYTRAETYLHK